MAKIIGGIGAGISGSIDELSIYNMRGVDKPVVRRKGGHTKERIKNDPNLALFRYAMSDFGGRAKAAKYLMKALAYQKPLADYNIAGPLTALMLPVQIADPIGDYGKRSIMLSAYRHFIKGFSLNHNNQFDSVVRYPLTCTLDRETATARVSIPELMPDINLVSPVNYPYYSLVVSLGVVPDIVHTANGFAPTHPDYIETKAQVTYTNWFPLLQGSPATEVEVKYESSLPDNNYTLVLAVGIRYGVLKAPNDIRQAPYVGSARVLEVG
jgi:hypothetical protein